MTHPIAEQPGAVEIPYHIRIEASRGWVNLGLAELWHYRQLLLFIVWRDIKVRYKQTALGVAWAIIQPFFTMIVFSVFFGRLAGVPSDNRPYPIFSFAGLVPWTFFATGLMQASNSLVESANLLKKVFFPRLILPIAAVLAGFVDLTVAFVMMLIMMISYGMTPTANIIWLPFFVLLAVTTSLGVGLWISAMNVKYRDFRYIMPFVTQLWMFITPVAYPASLISGPWKLIYGLNPMAGVVEGFRWALLGVDPPGPMTFVSAAAALVILVSGAFYFRRMEKTFADVV